MSEFDPIAAGKRYAQFDTAPCFRCLVDWYRLTNGEAALFRQSYLKEKGGAAALARILPQNCQSCAAFGKERAAYPQATGGAPPSNPTAPPTIRAVSAWYGLTIEEAMVFRLGYKEGRRSVGGGL